MDRDNRTQEVWSALGTVTDPEIDESVTSLNFVTSVQIQPGNEVRIEFRLPTYWCAPNFAFLMASDMRDAVTELPWVEKVTVELLDHFSADLINRGIALKTRLPRCISWGNRRRLERHTDEVSGKGFRTATRVVDPPFVGKWPGPGMDHGGKLAGTDVTAAGSRRR